MLPRFREGVEATYVPNTVPVCVAFKPGALLTASIHRRHLARHLIIHEKRPVLGLCVMQDRAQVSLIDWLSADFAPIKVSLVAGSGRAGNNPAASILELLATCYQPRPIVVFCRGVAHSGVNCNAGFAVPPTKMLPLLVLLWCACIR